MTNNSTIVSKGAIQEDYNSNSSSGSNYNTKKTYDSSQSESEVLSIFDAFGVLEHILSYCDTKTLLKATTINRRFKNAGRHDDLWIDAIKRLWKDKKGVYYLDPFVHYDSAAASSSSSFTAASASVSSRSQPQSQQQQQQHLNNIIFWRSLFSKDLVERMTEEQICCYLFGHPLLKPNMERFEQQLQQQQQQQQQLTSLSSSTGLQEQTSSSSNSKLLLLKRSSQLHMLDIMSDLTTEEVQQSEYVSLFGGMDDHDNDDDDSDINTDDDDDSDFNEDCVDFDVDVIDNLRNLRQQRMRQRRQNRRHQRPRALPRRHFFSDLYFGSYACSVMDSYRNRMTQLELCRPFGFLLYFKVDANELLEDLLEQPYDEDEEMMLLHHEPEVGDNEPDDRDDDDDDDDDDEDFNYAHAAARRGALEVYEGNRRILLYKHSICYFEAPDGSTDGADSSGGKSSTSSSISSSNNNSNMHGRKFRMEVLDHVENAFTTDLLWRWAVNGSKVQVGPYPPLRVNRRCDDWGWELENQHVVMRSLEYDGRHPEPRRSLPDVFIHAAADAESQRRRRRRRQRNQNQVRRRRSVDDL